MLFVSRDHDKRTCSFGCCAAHIIIKFLTNENVKSAEIVMRLRAQFGDGTLWRTRTYDPRVGNLKKAEQRFKICEDYTFCTVSYGQCILEILWRLIHQFSDRTKNHQRRLIFELLKELIKPTFPSKRRDRSVKRFLSPSRQLASAHRCCDNGNIEGNVLGGTATSCL